LLPGVFHAPFGHVADLKWFEEVLFDKLAPANEVAAIVVEPIQGEGGYIVPPDVFLQRLRELTTQHGMLLIVDEVQSGMGRTGRMFAIEHAGVEPDVVTMAKGIASGLPLGVATARAEMISWPPGTHASTFGGNPVACAAALTTIRLLREQLMRNAAVVGAHLLDGARALMDKHPLIGDVRGRGLMVGLELVRDRQSKERATTERDAVVRECFNRGLLVLGAGQNAIRLCPPLVLTREQADVALGILDGALSGVTGA
jgi:4-aminobutyrate aminotransferase